MLTVELRINGSIIVAATVTRKSLRSLNQLYEYEYQLARFPINNQGPCQTANGTLLHQFEDGADVLATKLFQAAAQDLRADRPQPAPAHSAGDISEGE